MPAPREIQVARAPAWTAEAQIFTASLAGAALVAVIVGLLTTWLVFFGVVVVVCGPLAFFVFQHRTLRPHLVADAAGLRGLSVSRWGIPIGLDVAWNDLSLIRCDNDVLEEEEAVLSSVRPTSAELTEPGAQEAAAALSKPRVRTADPHVVFETRWRSVLFRTEPFGIAPELIARRIRRCLEEGPDGARAAAADMERHRANVAAGSVLSGAGSGPRASRVLLVNERGLGSGPSSAALTVRPWDDVVAAHVVELRDKTVVDVELADGSALRLRERYTIGGRPIGLLDVAKLVAPRVVSPNTEPTVVEEPRAATLLLTLAPPGR